MFIANQQQQQQQLDSLLSHVTLIDILGQQPVADLASQLTFIVLCDCQRWLAVRRM
jgi:hypothetical protein